MPPLIGIFGGTFDPPHIGHLILASEARAQLGLERLLWVLTPDPPHKQGLPITPLEHRLAMLRLALQDAPGFELSFVEIDRPGPQNVQPGSPRQYPGMRPFGNYGFGGPGMYMRGRGMMGFGGFHIVGGIIRGLFTLGILALVVLGIIWLVSYVRRPRTYAAAVVPASPVSSVAPAAAPVATHPCPQCGELVQDNWKHCPNCGTTL